MQALDYPEISDNELNAEIDRERTLFVDAIKEGNPLPDELRRLFYE